MAIAAMFPHQDMGSYTGEQQWRLIKDLLFDSKMLELSNALEMSYP